MQTRASLSLNAHARSQQDAEQGHAVNTYSACKLALLHEVVTSLRHGKEKAAEAKSNARETQQRKAAEDKEESEDKLQNEAVVVAKRAAKKLKKYAKTKGEEKDKRLRRRLIWEVMQDEDIALESEAAGTGAAADADADDDVENAVELFQDTNKHSHKSRIKWEVEKIDRQVRKGVILVPLVRWFRWACIDTVPGYRFTSLRHTVLISIFVARHPAPQKKEVIDCDTLEKLQQCLQRRSISAG